MAFVHPPFGLTGNNAAIRPNSQYLKKATARRWVKLHFLPDKALKPHLFSVENLARDLWFGSKWHRTIYRRLHLVCAVGFAFCFAQRLPCANVCALRLRIWYSRDKDHLVWLHYTRLSRKVDAADQIGGSDAVCIRWPHFGQGRTHGPHCQLYWKHILTCFPKIWSKWGQEAWDSFGSSSGRRLGGLRSTNRWSSLFAGGSVILFSIEDIVAFILLCIDCRIRFTITDAVWQRAFRALFRGV